MKNREEDLCFRRWQEHADAESLTRVFDLTAPRLLLIALHVSQNSARAEDLVQMTFLQAMQDSARWDAAKGVFGWLSGILAHRAIDELRRARVRAAGSLKDWQADDSSKGPLQESLDRELVQKVAQKIDGLSDPYREVLILKLVHGLEPVEIAHTLKRAPGTVRMQLKRGLERLRQDLPKGIALPALLAFDPIRGLESIKKVIIGKSTAMQVAGTGGSTNMMTSGLLPSKFGLLGTGALILSLAVFWIWNSTTREDPLRIAFKSSAAPLPSAEYPATTSTMLRESLGERVEASRSPDETIAKHAPIESFKVRVCYGNEGNPAVGVGINLQLEGYQGLGHQAISDDNGLAHFAELASGRYRIVPDRGDAQWFELSQEDRRDLLIVLDEGVEVNGIVHDLQSNPFVGAQIYRLAEGHPHYAQLLASTDASGRFTIEHVSLGTELMARAAGFQPSRERTVRMADTQRVPLRLVLGALGNRVSGSVIGPNERPLAFASILIAVDEDARETMKGPTIEQVVAHDAKDPSPLDREGILVRADSDGAFSTTEVPRGPATFLARGGIADVPWIGFGTLDVHAHEDNQIALQVGPGGEIYGRVLDTRGMPFANVRVHAEWKGDSTFGELEDALGPLMANRETITDPNGDYRLRGLLPGRHDLSVGPRRKCLARHSVDVSSDVAHQWDVVLEPRPDLQIRLLDPAGAPLANWGVRVAPSVQHGAPRDMDRTDSAGRLKVRDLRYEPQAVCVHAPGSRTNELFGLHIHTLENVLPGGDEMVIQLPAECTPSARFTGQVVDARNNPLPGFTFRLRQEGQSGDDRFGLRASESEFQSPMLAPGTYTIELSKRNFARVTFGPFRLEADEIKDLGLLAVPDPNFPMITLQHVDGIALQDVEAYVYQGDMHYSSRWQLKRASGALPSQWTSSALPDGSFTLIAFAKNAAALRTTIDVSGGGEARYSFDLERGIKREIVAQYPAYIEGVSDRRSKEEARMDIKVIDEEGFVILDSRWDPPYADPIRRIGRFGLRLTEGNYTLQVGDTHDWENIKHIQVEFNSMSESGPIHVDFR